MLLLELTNKQIHDIVASSYQSLKHDHSKNSLGGLRQTKLTLAQIKQLRTWTDARNAERQIKLAHLRKQYRYIPPKGF